MIMSSPRRRRGALFSPTSLLDTTPMIEYRFLNGEGQEVIDSSPNINHGVLGYNSTVEASADPIWHPNWISTRVPTASFVSAPGALGGQQRISVVGVYRKVANGAAYNLWGTRTSSGFNGIHLQINAQNNRLLGKIAISSTVTDYNLGGPSNVTNAEEWFVAFQAINKPNSLLYQGLNKDVFSSYTVTGTYPLTAHGQFRVMTGYTTSPSSSSVTKGDCAWFGAWDRILTQTEYNNIYDRLKAGLLETRGIVIP